MRRHHEQKRSSQVEPKTMARIGMPTSASSWIIARVVALSASNLSAFALKGLRRPSSPHVLAQTVEISLRSASKAFFNRPTSSSRLRVGAIESAHTDTIASSALAPRPVGRPRSRCN
jgi:hypothetical protein